MATIIDPAGSVEVIFRDPSVTVVHGVVATGSDDTDAAQLTRYSAVNVVSVINDDAPAHGVKLPEAEEGDYFEIVVVSDPAYYVRIYNYDGSLASNSTTKTVMRYLAGVWRTYA